MNARPLVAWCAATLIGGLLSINPLQRGLVLLVAANVLVATARPGSRLRPVIATAAAGFAVAVVVSLLLSHTGDHVLLTLPGWLPGAGGPLTLEAATYGATAGLGVAAGVLAAASLGLAVEPQELVEVLPRFLERTATAAAATLNLVPQLARSAAAVAEAQRCRGWRPRGLRSWGSLLVPVTLTAMEDSLQLAEAMEARGYGSGPRTRLRGGGRRRGDRAVMMTAVVAAGALVAGRLAGGLQDWYPFPTLSPPPIDPLALLAAALLATPLVAWPRSTSAA